ncbi:conserved exported protein of unknown function [uncultured Sphingopyxis sp.]|uniref:PA domain-containing protein n=1 Tax=uncultured Sphingopyxis sp. TaxID=310581 RepID=A0A1Y5PN46_9SPHN|nr:hypothetical protein [uncultured Sphingopyxis sp.]SBV31472.1 conserved exported protein of unknown function [uncultured Sphingopyxis sp.]
MTRPTRRGFLAGATALPLAGTANARGAATAPDTVAADLSAYIGFGNKRSGGAGDTACGGWLAAELERAGFAVEKLPISVPWFEGEGCEIVAGAARAPLHPQPIVTPTPSEGATGPLVRVDAQGKADAPLAGAIALVDLPYGRWSSALAKPVRAPVDAAFAGGAKAAVIVTNGPTGQVIALNADGRAPMFAGPVGLLAPAEAAPFLDAAMRREAARVTLAGRGGRRAAFNLIGRLDRGKGRWITVSTPRSGWFGCAGERGGGIAAWLELARAAPELLPDHDLFFLCNSGHEYENLGAEEALKAAAPKPAETHFWLHLGANVAARDWHEGLFGLAPLAGSDSQRYLVVSPPLLPAARRLFAGLAGLESPYPSDRLSAGELTAIIAAGYPSVAGVFGLHRFHHVAGDDARCVDAAAVAAATAAFRQLLVTAAA